MIRGYRESDREKIKAITVICFDGVSIDQNIEGVYGLIGGRGWQFRKAGHIDADVAGEPGGIFVYEVEGETVGYVTARSDRETKVGRIPNLSVLPDYQRRGIGRALIEKAIDYLRTAGMEFVRIETLEQNEMGRALYPRLGFREVARQIHYIKPIRAQAGSGGAMA